jgi:phenylalanyl-tRNA synthetase beta chain
MATQDAIDVYPKPLAPRIVAFHPQRVQELTSLAVDPREMNRILFGLGFEQVDTSLPQLNFKVPSWRIDVDQEVDLIEEIARHAGYDKIGSELPPSNAAGEYQPSEMKQRILRRALNAFGFDEGINFSFIQQEAQFDLIPSFAGLENSQVQLKNPIIEEASRMRQTLLPGLLNSVRHNLNHSIRDIRLFEIGRIFAVSSLGNLPEERLAFAAVATGGALEEGRAQAERELDFFDLKGALETAVSWMNLSPLRFAETSARHLRVGQAAKISLIDGKEIGAVGRLAEGLASSYKFRQPVFVVELDLSGLLAGPEKVVQYSPLPRYPSVVRDLSLLVGRKIAFDEILKGVNDQQVADCRSVKLVGVYEGVNIPASKRSLTLRIEYRSDERTLRDEEVEERHAHLTASLLKTFSAEQR